MQKKSLWQTIKRLWYTTNNKVIPIEIYRSNTMVNPTTLSNNILMRSFEENISVSPMKLQKLLYLTYKHYLKHYNIELFSEKFEVWKYGPVLRSVYCEFNAYKGNRIENYSKDSVGNSHIIRETDSPKLKDTLDFVWSHYKRFTGTELSTMTHKKGTAWDKAYNRGDKVLSNEDIRAEEDYEK